jgi:ketosteroid isomerase-like protein
MSGRNVDLVRRLLDVYNERSFEQNHDLIDPDVVWDMSRVELPDAGSYSGRSELRSFVEAWEEGFVSDHLEAKETFDAGDRVVVMVHHRGRGKSSGIDIDQRFAMVWTFRGGRAIRMEMYPTLEEALEAVGLSDSEQRAAG